MRAVAILGAMVLAVGAQARTAPASAGPGVAEARTLIRTMRAEDVIRRTLDTQMKALGPGMTDQIFQSGAFPPELANDADFRAILQRHLDRVMAVVGGQTKTALPQIVEQMTAIYAREFTPGQIGDMTAFYRTPTGQALLEKTPDITAEVATQTSALIMGPLMQTLQAETPKLMAELKAWADTHPQAKAPQP